MALALNKKFFKRNRHRETEFGAFFNKTSTNLNYLMGLIITIFFTPAIVVASLLSKEILLILINLSLSLGFVCNYVYKCYKGEVSKLDMLITFGCLVGCVALAYFLCPPITGLTLLSVLVYTNQAAIAVNLFFTFKQAIVTPIMKLIKNIGSWLGFEIPSRYFIKLPLNVDEDRYVVDILLRKNHGYDSLSPKFENVQLKTFNKLIEVLSNYINKYDAPILGYLNNRTAITELEKSVDAIVTKGQTDSATAFINKKIDFKHTKLALLKKAHDEIKGLKSTKDDPYECVQKYLVNVDHQQLTSNRTRFFSDALFTIDAEIRRQEEKIKTLELCRLGN